MVGTSPGPIEFPAEGCSTHRFLKSTAPRRIDENHPSRAEILVASRQKRRAELEASDHDEFSPATFSFEIRTAFLPWTARKHALQQAAGLCASRAFSNEHAPAAMVSARGTSARNSPIRIALCHEHTDAPYRPGCRAGFPVFARSLPALTARPHFRTGNEPARGDWGHDHIAGWLCDRGCSAVIVISHAVVGRVRSSRSLQGEQNRGAPQARPAGARARDGTLNTLDAGDMTFIPKPGTAASH